MAGRGARTRGPVARQQLAPDDNRGVGVSTFLLRIFRVTKHYPKVRFPDLKEIRMTKGRSVESPLPDGRGSEAHLDPKPNRDREGADFQRSGL